MTIKLLKTTLALAPLVIAMPIFAQHSDPLYPQQWHLKNTGQTAFSANGGKKGQDMRVAAAHSRGILGQGIKVTVIDTGVQIDHIDLADNIVFGSRDLLNGGDYPIDTNGHGTAVAGIIAAVGYNGEGVRGVAPFASLNGFNFLAEQSLLSFLISHGKGEGTKDTHIFNQSYGGGDIFPRTYDPVNDLELAITEDAMKDVTLNNANGRGATFVKSAGNGYNSFGYGKYFILPGNYFTAADDGELRNLGLPMENSNAEISDANFWNTVVSAVNARGKRSSYSSVGSNVFMTATGGEYGSENPAMVTIDLMGCDSGFNVADGLGENELHGGTDIDPDCNYTSVMNGTSSAAPSFTGAIATVMSANSLLSPRDAKHLLAKTATKTNKKHRGVTLKFINNHGDEVKYKAIDGWKKNAAGFKYHMFYGLGRPNINKAVKLATKKGRKAYKPLSALRISPWNTLATHVEIPDASLRGGSANQYVNIARKFKIEGVQIKLDIEHSRLNDLSIELISPSGTRSVIMTPKSGAFVGQFFDETITGLKDQLFLSHHFYGEKARGNWKLKVVDTNGGDGDWILYDRVEGAPSTISPENNAQPGVITNWSIRFFGHKG
ncbi:MAG: S8 family serine peptidase [Psychrobium sp.]|nr:S8 family serine peptidase [Psychrobium sp.]